MKKNFTDSLKFYSPLLLIVVAIAFMILLKWIYVQHVSLNHENPTYLYNQETLGQLGDFVGGLLNPFLTFITVILLLHSTSLNRKQLTLTINEYNRKQIEEAINRLYLQFDKLLDEPVWYENKSTTLKKMLIHDENISTTTRHVLYKNTPKSIGSSQTTLTFLKIGKTIDEIAELTAELIKITINKSLKDHWAKPAISLISKWEFIDSKIPREEKINKIKDSYNQ